MKKISFALLALSFVFFACGPSSDHLTYYQKTGTYPVTGECKEPIAAVVVERNGRFDVVASMGSAFLIDLIDKERGVFVTADHVIDLDTKYRLFLCGKVYDASRKLDRGVTDIGFLEIIGKFDPSDFPEPYPVGDTPKVGDNVFVRGVHMHPTGLQYGKTIHRIVETYYGIQLVQKARGTEFVYDNLEAKIVDMSQRLQYSKEEDEEFREYLIRNNLTPLKTKEDHIIPFKGLSGGPTINENGQVVGINVIQHDEGYFVWDEKGLGVVPRKTLEILPSDEIKNALDRLNLRAR